MEGRAIKVDRFDKPCARVAVATSGAAARPERRESAWTVPPAPALEGQRKAALVVDDDPRIRVQMTGFFEDVELPCEICREPADALALLQAAPERFGVVFVEILFPEGPKGFDFAVALRGIEACRDLPIIGMTADHAIQGSPRIAESGMVELIPKPLFKWLVIHLATWFCEEGDD